VFTAITLTDIDKSGYLKNATNFGGIGLNDSSHRQLGIANVWRLPKG